MKIMSKKLSLVVFLAIVGSIACQDCFTGIKKWVQCKYIPNLMTQPQKNGVFVQNTAFPFDIISDQFIQALNLSVQYPNFTSAMNFFRNTIYSAKNKKNKCFFTKFLDQRGKYSTLFSNTNFFNDALEILTNFSREYPTRLSSPKSTTAEYWNKFGANSLSTLKQFCIKNDFTSNVYDFYSSSDPLCNIDDDNYEEEYYSCVYDTIVNSVKRTVTTSPSKTQLTTLAKCSIKPLNKCNKTVTNLFSLYDFTDYWPQLPIPNKKKGMINYFASLLESPSKSSRNFTYAHAQWSATFLSVSSPTEGEISGAGLWCNSTHVDVIFNTSITSITGTWSNCRLTNITIKTQFTSNPDSKKNATKGFSIVNPNVKQTDKKYFKDPTNKKNWLFVRVSKNDTGVNRTQINDLEANVNIIIEPNRIDIFFETSSLSEASGIVIDGFDDEDVIMAGRKRREVNDDDAAACKLECSSRKRRWTGPVLDDENSESSGSAAKEGDLHAHILDHITARAGCVRECLRR